MQYAIRSCRFCLLAIAPILALVSYMLSWTPGLFTAVVLIFLHNTVYGFQKISKRCAFLCFNFTFFVFLLGRLVISIINYGELSFGFDHEIELHTYLLLFISLLLLAVGYAISEKIPSKAHQSANNFSSPLTEQFNQNEFAKCVQRISLLVLIAVYIPYIITIAERVSYAQAYSYQALYLREASGVPFIIKKLSEMFIPALYVYLATMPKKKSCIIPMAMYLFGGFYSMFSGRRTEFVLVVMVLLFYIISRDRYSRAGEKWLGKAEVIIIIAGMPIACVVLYYFGLSRYGLDTQENSLLNSIQGIFYEQGVSYRVIAYAKQYENLLPDNQFFFGPIIEYLKSNAVTKLFFTDFESYGAQTVAQALHGVSFGDSLSYLVNESRYLSGGGTGGCYIAESFFCYGYIGLGIINVIYGVMLNIFDRFFGKNIWLNAFFMFAVYRIFYSPRSSSLSFLTQALNIINILTIGAIFVLSLILYEHYKVQQKPDAEAEEK